MEKLEGICSYIVGVFASLKDSWLFNASGAYLILLAGFLFNLDALNLIAGLLVLNIFDFITGIIGAKVYGDCISSAKAIHSVYKTLAYALAIATANLVDKSLGISNWTLSFNYGLISYLSVTEGTSILENLSKMGFTMPTRIINNMKCYLEKNKKEDTG
ncbi:phage holin family protein [Methanoculleus sp.]|uniref:phage holin family protein n=1 Tax=Methanoculleus sp. TaxID=90427 RepID=UPI0025ED41AF|nr:phage holin family protein [Methanoculleus sp.]MCK9320049.1 phage holin family protein [Methanoculleus sp.]